MSFLNKKAIKEFCKKYDRRVGKDFFSRLELDIKISLENACGTHNGGKVTLDDAIAEYISLRTGNDRIGVEDDADK